MNKEDINKEDNNKKNKNKKDIYTCKPIIYEK